MKKIITLVLTVFICFSCDVAQQLAGAYSLTQCKYSYNSISGLSLAGINLQNASSLSSLNASSAAALVAAFATSSGSLPLNFTLNLNVENPNMQTALLNGLGYILEIDGMEMTSGSLTQQFQVGANQTATLPLTLGFDLKKVMSGQSLDAMKNLAFNFAGIGSSSSNVTLKLQPSLLIGTQTIKSPSYIPVSFTLNK